VNRRPVTGGRTPRPPIRGGPHPRPPGQLGWRAAYESEAHREYRLRRNPSATTLWRLRTTLLVSLMPTMQQATRAFLDFAAAAATASARESSGARWLAAFKRLIGRET